MVAQDLYLRGRYLMTRGWLAVSEQGTKLLREAHLRAPEDTRIAGAYALAVARVQTAGEVSPDAIGEARAIAERTLEVAPAQAEARVALAFIHLSESEVTAASVQLTRALATAPNSVEALDAVARLVAEVGPTAAAIRALEGVLAIEPTVSHSQQALARVHALLGDVQRAYAVLGPVPTELHDFAPHMLLKARMALWHGDADAARELVRVFEQWPGSPSVFVREAVLGLAAITIQREKAAAIGARLDPMLPLESRFSPRRLCFHSQIRVEAKLGLRDIEGALRDLRVGDSNGLLDLVWLDNAPLFEGLRARPEFIAIRESTALRAERVRRILAP
jgi:Tfp pilus assembly protein PilF